MKLGDKVGVVCDHTLIEEARAIRAALESFRLHVELYRLVQRGQAEDFFGRGLVAGTADLHLRAGECKMTGHRASCQKSRYDNHR